jgi:hypothetical protein
VNAGTLFQSANQFIVDASNQQVCHFNSPTAFDIIDINSCLSPQAAGASRLTCAPFYYQS